MLVTLYGAERPLCRSALAWHVGQRDLAGRVCMISSMHSRAQYECTLLSSVSRSRPILQQNIGAKAWGRIPYLVIAPLPHFWSAARPDR